MFEQIFSDFIPSAYVAEWVLAYGKWWSGLFVQADLLEHSLVSWIGAQIEHVSVWYYLKIAP